MEPNRNEVICRLYKEGFTQEKLARIYELSEQRISQILARKNVTKLDKPYKPPRNKFTAVLLTNTVKEAAKLEAKSEDKALAHFISDILTAELRRRGIETDEVRPESLPLSPRLPLEDA